MQYIVILILTLIVFYYKDKLNKSNKLCKDSLDLSLKEINKNIDIKKNMKEMEELNKNLVISMANINIKEILNEQMDVMAMVNNMPEKHKNKNRKKILSLLYGLENKKNDILISLYKSQISAPMPSIIEDMDVVIVTTPEEYVDKYIFFAFDSILDLINIEETALEKNEREARCFFGDLTKNNPLIKDKIPVVINRNKH